MLLIYQYLKRRCLFGYIHTLDAFVQLSKVLDWQLNVQIIELLSFLFLRKCKLHIHYNVRVVLLFYELAFMIKSIPYKRSNVIYCSLMISSTHYSDSLFPNVHMFRHYHSHRTLSQILVRGEACENSE